MELYTTYYLKYNANFLNLIYIKSIIILITGLFKHMGGGRDR